MFIFNLIICWANLLVNHKARKPLSGPLIKCIWGAHMAARVITAASELGSAHLTTNHSFLEILILTKHGLGLSQHWAWGAQRVRALESGLRFPPLMVEVSVCLLGCKCQRQFLARAACEVNARTPSMSAIAWNEPHEEWLCSILL